jgi:hypothetical protein
MDSMNQSFFSNSDNRFLFLSGNFQPMSRWNLTLLMVVIFFSCCFIFNCAADSDIVLSGGWNFVSIPLMHPLTQYPDNQNYSLFSNIDTEGHSIWRYSALTEHWDKIYPDSAISSSDGIWIFSHNSTSVQVQGDNSEATLPKQLYSGWNAVGFAGSELPADQAFSSLGDNWRIIINYNAALQQYNGTIFNSDPSNKSLIESGKGYWIFMSGPAEYMPPPVTEPTKIPTTVPLTTVPTTTTTPTTVPTTSVPTTEQTTLPPTTVPLTTIPTTDPTTTVPTTAILTTTVPTTIIPPTDPTTIPTTAVPTTVQTWWSCGG